MKNNMNIDVMKVIKENQVSALIISAALIIFLIYIIGIAPVTHKLQIKYMECKACEDQVTDARGLIELGRNIDKEYGGRTLISEEQAAAGIEEFAKYGKSMGINFISIKPETVIRPEGAQYKILPIDISLEAESGQFVKFIGSLDKLKKAIVSVKNFDIVPDKSDRKMLKVNMVMDIYFSLQEGNAEEM